MKTIHVINRKGQSFDILVDDEDFAFVSQASWYCTKNGNNYYAANDSFFGKKTYMHRLVSNASKGKDVDHINGNSLDNRKQNLRICTRQQNICNAKKGVDCTSQYIGVSWDKSRNLWRVAIMFSRRSIYLGRFKIERDAATAYNEAAAKLFGEFARLNNV